jgi:hypothetical protein
VIERIIHQLLEVGRDQLLEDNAKLVRRHFLRSKRIGEDEAEKFVDYFQTHPPTVIEQYPRGEGVKFPCWSVLLAGEKESTSFLAGEGDFLGDSSEIDDDDPDAGANEYASMFSVNYGVLVVAEHPDVCRWYYELAKFILQRGRNFLLEAMSEVFFSGQDLAPDPRYLPAHLFVRQLGIDGLRVERAVGEQPGVIRSVDGIHVAENEAGISGVETLLVPNPGLADGDED